MTETTGHSHLVERVVPFTTDDGLQLNLINVRGEREPHRGPVVLVHGAGVRGQHLPRPGRDHDRRHARGPGLRRVARELEGQHRLRAQQLDP